MINRRLLLLSGAAAAAAWAHAGSYPAGPAYQLDLARLPGPFEGKYRVDPYLQAASALQALGRQGALQQLCSEAKRMEGDEHPLRAQNEALIILCRMLFTPRKGGRLLPPGLGAGYFLGDTYSDSWPVQPITLVNGLPFLVTWGYDIAGEPERGSNYLARCIQHCAWSSSRFRPHTMPEKVSALTALLFSSRWKRPVEKWERAFLTAQIQ